VRRKSVRLNLVRGQRLASPNNRGVKKAKGLLWEKFHKPAKLISVMAAGMGLPLNFRFTDDIKYCADVAQPVAFIR
jgi:hypothetical protein